MEKVKLKFNGIMMKIYRGFDPATRTVIVAHPGATVTVSQIKAVQLFKDFPKDWEEVKDVTAQIPQPADEKSAAAPAAPEASEEKKPAKKSNRRKAK